MAPMRAGSGSEPAPLAPDGRAAATRAVRVTLAPGSGAADLPPLVLEPPGAGDAPATLVVLDR